MSPEQVQQFLQTVETSLGTDILPQVSLLSGGTDSDNDESVILLVGVSGGCDSMALLHALLDISTTAVNPTPPQDSNNRMAGARRCFHNLNQDFELHVVHFDHCQRGLESQLDCQLVQDTCKERGVPCHVYTWDDDNDDGTENNKTFSQDSARKWRQSTMAQLLQTLTSTTIASSLMDDGVADDSSSQRRRPGVILTAHHADDSQETILLKLLRGVHIQNLSGMAPLQQIQQDGTTLLGRPLLELTKNQIQGYLHSQGYVWREDASNQSNKYLRNRVRNQLIPLLEDLVGSQDVLTKRLRNLEEQCQHLQTDLSSRADEVMKRHVDARGHFLLPQNKELLSDLVMRQAMYSWISSSANNQQFSYDVWKNVELQLEDYPNNRQWTLPLGDGWHVTRLGDSLQVVSQLVSEDVETENTAEIRGEPLRWSCIDSQGTQPDGGDSEIRLHTALTITDHSSLRFVKTTVACSSGVKWMFTPPWRKGRSPLKLKNFLRGQKVPLHLRDLVPIVYGNHEGELDPPSLVAVFVNGEWIVDAAWDPSFVGTAKDSNIIVLRLTKDDT
ncbi:lysidine synthase [Seminavis robusta]|uniref:tRNA(Ile)-lysidine synthetase n=1 Tax=Seminavis robusta TaxID=568900 RepID=A0A9N8HYJ6_9STRA|nr:lysidine synthase [Seminavis robusta]|eukprot:Sro2884_g339320.1 lysidine synthase (558) ;mRNA; r:2780-4582